MTTYSEEPLWTTTTSAPNGSSASTTNAAGSASTAEPTTTPELWTLVLADNEPGGSMLRRARASMCPKCDAYRLHGLDADMAALPAMCDPEPISGLGEVQATIAGLRTYELSRHGGGFQIDGRDFTHVKGRPAGAGVVDVLVEHRCGFNPDRASPVLRLRRPSINAVPDF